MNIYVPSEFLFNPILKEEKVVAETWLVKAYDIEGSAVLKFKVLRDVQIVFEKSYHDLEFSILDRFAVKTLFENTSAYEQLQIVRELIEFGVQEGKQEIKAEFKKLLE